MPASPSPHVDPSQGSFNDPFPPFDRQLRQDVHHNVLAPHRPHPMALSMASPVQSQMQDITQQLPGQQLSQDSLRAALPRPKPQNPVTDEVLRRLLADLDAPVAIFHPSDRGVGRMRAAELEAPKEKDYTSEDFERAQKCYKRYYNAWRNFFSAKSKLEKASCQEKGRLQRHILKKAELLKGTTEDYLSFKRSGLPLKNGIALEQKQKRLKELRANLEMWNENISKLHRALSRGAITQETAELPYNLPHLRWVKSKTEGEIADIEYGIQHGFLSLNEGQSTAGNANAGNVPPAHAGSLRQEAFRSDYLPSTSSGSSAYEKGETSYVSRVPEQHFITSGALPFHSHQLAPSNTEIRNTLHAKPGPPSEGADSGFATTDRGLLADP